MTNNHVLDFKEISNRKLREQFELEGCDEELMDLVSKLANCSPGSMNVKKKDFFKSELLKKIKEERSKASACVELSDDDLDSAAGGIKLPEGPDPSKGKPPNGENR